MCMHAKNARYQKRTLQIPRNCTEQIDNDLEQCRLDDRLEASGYDLLFIASTKQGVYPSRVHSNIHSNNHYLNMQFFSDTLNGEILKIFAEDKLPIRLAQRSTPLQLFFRQKPNENFQCTDNTCVLRSSLCHQPRVIYNNTCPSCSKFYYGSTMRRLHTRYKEHHFTDKKSSIYKHKLICKKNFNSVVIKKSSTLQRLRFEEAFLIRKDKPPLNGRDETACINLLL